MKRIFLPLALLVLSIPGFGRVICDTTCHAPEDEFRNFAVVSPVGRSMVTHIEQSEGGQTTTTPPWYDRTEATQKTVPCMRKDSTIFIITGDTARNKVQVMPGGAHSIAAVEIPAKWDSIMGAKGYPSLESFYLTETGERPTTDIVETTASDMPVRYNGRVIVNDDHRNIAVYDASGKMIARTNSHYNMHSLPSGVYMVYVQGVKGALKITRP